MKIGERIKIRRQELEWSQRELAAKMNYSHHSTLARIENGQIDVRQSKIVQFAEVLGVSVSYLMGWEENDKNYSPQNEEQPTESELSIRKKEFIKKIEGMSDAQLDRLEQILALVENTTL